ncbi:unnamed protein product [Lactuca virosa]|uniref:Retrotransposon gag domain-containing protein n=1 Tax=Lactuca virosa TaxID=75947 RepID=A0AAU9MCE3_9ASTR|nr:unnamed protein product [Lactuca virosa]
MASIERKIDEVLKAVLKSNPDESDRGKKVSEEGSSGGTEIPVETTPRMGSNPQKTFTGKSGSGGGNGGGPGDWAGGGNGSNGGANWRFQKLDMPLFDGNFPDGWVLRAERYFKFCRLSEEDKVEAAVVALEGDALLWFQWEHQRILIVRWEKMKSLLLRQFRPTNVGTLQEQWLVLSQVGSVLEYQRSFIELLALLTNIPDDISMGQFINGLKDEIRSEVRLLGPLSVDHAMSLAIKVEDKLRAQQGKKSSPVTISNPSTITRPTHSTGFISGSPLITPIKTTYF